MLPFLLAGLALLGVGTAPILVRPELASARVLFVFSLSASVAFGFAVFDSFFAYRFVPWSLAATALAKASFLHLALLFPKPRWPLTRFPRALPAAIYVAMGGPVDRLRLADGARFRAHRVARDRRLATFGFGAIVLGANIAAAAFQRDDARLRQQARVLILSPILGCLRRAAARRIGAAARRGGDPPCGVS